MAIGWFPSTTGGYILLFLLLLAISWWLTGRLFRERDLTTTVFRGLVSLLACLGIAYFHYASVGMMRQEPLATVVKTKAEKDAPIQENMRQWVTAAAYDAYWSTPATDPGKLSQKPPAESKDFEAIKTNPAILVESAVRGLTWMALEHRRPSPFGRNAYPHAERGTKALNSFTVPQAQAMFDFILTVSPASQRDVRPYLADALAYCGETSAPVSPAPSAPPAAAPVGSAGKSAAVQYPFIVVSRETGHGRAFVIRISATQMRTVEAASEEEALRIAKEK